MSSTESGSEDSNSLKDQSVGAGPGATGKGLQHVSSAVSLHKVDSASSLSSIYNMYDLHSGQPLSKALGAYQSPPYSPEVQSIICIWREVCVNWNGYSRVY